MLTVASHVRALDPRLKMGVAFALGPGLWMLPVISVAVLGTVLLLTTLSLAVEEPVGGKMVRTLFSFTALWVGIKVFMDAFSGMEPLQIALGGGELALRLIALLLLGLALALSTSPRSLGLAVSWVLRPIIGQERAWKVALSLALMIHFLPFCLGTMTQVRDSFSRRCPKSGLRDRLTVIPLAILRNLGQKTWNQTLAVAGRGLEQAGAWEPDFTWTKRDSAFLVLFACIGSVLIYV